MDQKKTAYLGLFAAIAIIFGYVESLIPFFAGIPGMKLGLANLAVLFVLERYTWKEAALVSLVRIFVVGFLFGNVKNKVGFGHLGVSVAGGVSHNIGQLMVAIPATHTVGLLYYYAPALMVSGVVTGLLIGVLTREVLKRIP